MRKAARAMRGPPHPQSAQRRRPAVTRRIGVTAGRPAPLSQAVEGNAAMSSQSTKTAPYGSWKSPITSELIVAQSIILSELCLDRGHVYLLGGSPQEHGRYVLLLARSQRH